MSAFWYLASPYTKHPRGAEVACAEACIAAAICFKSGVLVFSPIAHTHAIAVEGNLAGHFEQWAAFDEAMIRASAGMIVVTIDGWQQSTGISAEVDICERLGKPVFYMPPFGPAPDLVLREPAA